MPCLQNRQVRLKTRPSGIPQAEHFEIVTVAVAEPTEGQVIVRNIYLSVEPAKRSLFLPRQARSVLASVRLPRSRLRALAQWVRDGLINDREEFLERIEPAPGAIAGLYRGENLGKRLIRIADA